MKDRKTFKANLENKKGMHFLLGLVLTLTFTIVMIELKQYEGELMDLGQMTGIEDEEVIPITNRDPAPPPPPPPKPPEVIQIVEDDIEIEEIEFESTETDESEEIEIVEEVEEESDEILSFAVVENKPVYPGCENEPDEAARFKCFNRSIMKTVQKNFVYPEMAKQMQLSDKVWVSFVIEKNGKITNVKVERGQYDDLNSEATRLIKLLPKMKPAKQRGKPVRMSYTVPINFKLQ